MTCNGVLYFGSTGDSNNKSNGEADPLLRIANHDVKHEDENKVPDKTHCQPGMILLIMNILHYCDIHSGHSYFFDDRRRNFEKALKRVRIFRRSSKKRRNLSVESTLKFRRLAEKHWKCRKLVHLSTVVR